MKKYLKLLRPNPLTKILRNAKAQHHRNFLILWNRGLGDIPLGLYALNLAIKKEIPEAKITYLTRENLLSGFQMLPGSYAIADPEMKRGNPVDIIVTLKKLGINTGQFDVIIPDADPTRWVPWQIGRVVPKLSYNCAWEKKINNFGLVGKKYFAAHVDTETGQYYGYEKNWPVEYWQELFSKIDQEIILFGVKKDECFLGRNIIDLRGETSLQDLLAILVCNVTNLIAPDSGILSTSYYVNHQYPINIYSLWSDPRQGVLKQKVASPNKLLKHFPFISEKNLKEITPEKLLTDICQPVAN